MSKKNIQDLLVVGFALFATFFGAGNLIFPPSIGLAAGSSWSVALTGFFLAGIVLPVLAFIAVSKTGGTLESIADKVSPKFGKIYGIIVMTCIGVMVAIPRTGATTHELGIHPIFPQVSPIITSLIFYGLTIYFAINPTKVIDKIGKILTPVLLLIMFIIIIKGIITPLSSPANTGLENVFSKGFIDGYQTADALTGLVTSGVIVAAILAKGYTDKKIKGKMITLCGIIAGLALFLIYGGLVYIGATGAGVFPNDIEKTNLLIGLVQKIMGNSGLTFLGIAVIFACLTTSVGVSAAVADFYSRLTNNRLSYKTAIILISVISGIIANVGVEAIVNLAMPVLLVIYPISIVLIIMGLFNQYIPNRGAYIGATYCTLFISLFDTMGMLGIKTPVISSFINHLPFANMGFSWLVPAVVGFIAGMFVYKKTIIKDSLISKESA